MKNMIATNTLKSTDGFFKISLKINGENKNFKVKSNEFLLDALRRHGYKGAKKGCDSGDCGSCAIIFNGKPVLACMMPAVTAHGGDIETIEGIGTIEKPHPIQEAYVEAGAVQCGYCTPGMIVVTKHLLEKKSSPSEEEIKKELDGNLCRCTGYVTQIKAVKIAAKKMKKKSKK
ncbi:MAG: (2Fe-2S)-binding protein [Elusimicrobiota bacterium]|nr:(2Fe-2S)-binding protein [Elusimicrobiota bacterium]